MSAPTVLGEQPANSTTDGATSAPSLSSVKTSATLDVPQIALAQLAAISDAAPEPTSQIFNSNKRLQAARVAPGETTSRLEQETGVLSMLDEPLADSTADAAFASSAPLASSTASTSDDGPHEPSAFHHGINSAGAASAAAASSRETKADSQVDIVRHSDECESNRVQFIATTRAQQQTKTDSHSPAVVASFIPSVDGWVRDLATEGIEPNPGWTCPWCDAKNPSAHLRCGDCNKLSSDVPLAAASSSAAASPSPSGPLGVSASARPVEAEMRRAPSASARVASSPSPHLVSVVATAAAPFRPQPTVRPALPLVYDSKFPAGELHFFRTRPVEDFFGPQAAALLAPQHEVPIEIQLGSSAERVAIRTKTKRWLSDFFRVHKRMCQQLAVPYTLGSCKLWSLDFLRQHPTGRRPASTGVHAVVHFCRVPATATAPAVNVAVKVFNKTYEDKETGETKTTEPKDIYREASFLAILSRLGVVGCQPLLGLAWTNDREMFRIVTEELPGETLEEACERRGSLGKSSSRLKHHLSCRLALHLSQLHAYGIYHNDLHFGNMLLGSSASGLPDLWIIDFSEAVLCPYSRQSAFSEVQSAAQEAMILDFKRFVMVYDQLFTGPISEKVKITVNNFRRAQAMSLTNEKLPTYNKALFVVIYNLLTGDPDTLKYGLEFDIFHAQAQVAADIFYHVAIPVHNIFDLMPYEHHHGTMQTVAINSKYSPLACEYSLYSMKVVDVILEASGPLSVEQSNIRDQCLAVKENSAGWPTDMSAAMRANFMREQQLWQLRFMDIMLPPASDEPNSKAWEQMSRDLAEVAVQQHVIDSSKANVAKRRAAELLELTSPD